MRYALSSLKTIVQLNTYCMKKILQLFALVGVLFSSSLLYAQDRSVSGNVTSSDDGSPIPGANVLIKGTTTGTVTDIDGNYKLTVPTDGTTLVISFIGYGSQEIEVGTRSVIDVSLNTDLTELSEVVVTAVGIEREKRSLGYSVEGMTDDEVQQKSEPDILKAMQGKVPGVQILGSSGAPGSATRITIRGASSFLGNNSPLFVVDGIPYDNTQYNTSNQLLGGGAYGSPLSNLDPNTIASINILKGAAAAALYGTRASNGVIIITTKGSSSKVSKKGLEVTFSTSYSQERIANLPDYQNKYGNGSEFNYQNANGSWGPAFAARDSFPTWPTYTAAFPDLPTNSPYVAQPNNVSDLFEVGNVFENSLSVIGGNEKATLSASVSNLSQGGYIPGSSFGRTTLAVGGNAELVNGLILSSNVTYTRSDTKGPFFGENGANGAEVASSFARTLWLGRTWNSDLPFETPTGGNVFYNGNGIDNPRWSWKHNGVEEHTDRIGGSFGLGFDITDWLNVNYKIGNNQYTTTRKQIYDIGSNAYAGAGAIATDDFSFEEVDSNLIITGQYDINEDINLTALVGQNVNQRSTKRQSVLGTTLVAPDIFDINNTNNLVPNGGGVTKRRLMGVFYDISLGYKNYLFFNTTGRNDWSSTLPTDNNSYFYPSASLAFVFTDALNISGNIISFGKLRASWAKVGNDAAPHSLQNVFNVNLGQASGLIGSNNDSDFPFNGQPALTMSNTASDPNLTPEFTKEYEFGTNLQFLNNRIGLDVTYYNRNSTDQIAAISVPSATGFNNLFTNFGDLENKGWEVGLDLTPVQITDGFGWNIFVNYTKNTNTVISLAEGVTRINIRNLFGGGIRPVLEPGHPYGSLYGTTSAKDSEGNWLISPATGLLFPAVGNDPESGRFQHLGDPNPNFTVDMSNTFTWKGFKLDVLMSYKDGGAIYSTTVERLMGRGVAADTEDREKSVIIPGFLGDPATGLPLLDDNGDKIPNTIQATTNDLFFAAGGPESFFINGADEASVYDGTVIRLREVSLSYSLPESLLSKTPFGSAMVSVSGRNLWHYAPNIPHSTNFDPEVNGFGATNTQGIEYAAAPQARRYGVNLRFTF